MIDSSTYDYVLPNDVFRLIKCVVLLGAAFSVFTYRKYSFKYIMVFAFVTIMLMVMLIVGNYFVTMAIPLLLALASEVTDFKSILKCIVLATALTTIFIMLSCALHIIPDYVYTHRMGENIAMTAHSCGFKYYSSLGYICMALTAIYLYLHINIPYIKLGAVLLANYALYLVHTNQTAIAFVAFLLLAYVFTKKIRLFNFNNKFWKFVSTIIPSLLCFGTLGLINLYKDNILVLSSRFRTLTGRLIYSVQAINEYGISLFGSKVTMYGVTQKVYGNATSAFYIDSGFLYSFIAYGIIFTILIILIYTIIYRYVADIGDGFLYIWLGGILALCVINNYLLSCYVNQFIFLLPYALRSTFRKRQKNFS